jgi:predicted HTH transcriptional regulator
VQRSKNEGIDLTDRQKQVLEYIIDNPRISRKQLSEFGFGFGFVMINGL